MPLSPAQRKIRKLGSILAEYDIVLGQYPLKGGQGIYTAYYFESGIPGDPNSEEFWRSDRTGEIWWHEEAEFVQVRVSGRTTAQKVADALISALDA